MGPTKITRTRRGRQPKLESSLFSDDSKPQTDDKDEIVEGTKRGRKRRSIKSVEAVPIQDTDETNPTKNLCEQPKAVKRGRGRPARSIAANPEGNEQKTSKEQAEEKTKSE